MAVLNCGEVSSHMLESFYKLLDGERSEEIVWTADISYWISGQVAKGTARSDLSNEEGYLAFCRELGIMPYYWYDKFWLGEPEYDGNIQIEREEHADITTRVWKTPIGELVEQLVYLPESYSTAHTKFPVSNKNELDIFRYILEHRRLLPACIDDYRERQRMWERYDGIPAVAMPRSPLASFFYEWAGVEQGVYLLMDHHDALREIFNIMEAQERPVIDAVCDLSPPIVHFADNLSSDNMAGFYDAFMLAGHVKRLERFHAKKIACAVHLDGVVAGLLPKLSAAGFDAIEALTPAPGGDTRVEEMRRLASSNTVILWGGIPGVLFAQPYTWKAMRKHTENVLAAWRDTPFILGVADQVPPDGDIGFCRKIADYITTENYC